MLIANFDQRMLLKCDVKYITTSMPYRPRAAKK